MIRADSQCGRVLRVLADGKPHTVTEIHRRAGTMRLNSRVSELRKAGYGIVCTQDGRGKGPGRYRYQLLSHTETYNQPGPLYILAQSEANEPVHEIDGDAYAPRDEANRYRIYRLTGGDDLQLVATASDYESVGVALMTLGEEGEFDRCAVGVLDGLAFETKKWRINPYDAKATL